VDSFGRCESTASLRNYGNCLPVDKVFNCLLVVVVVVVVVVLVVGPISTAAMSAYCSLTPQWSSVIHLQRRERPLLAKDGTKAKEFSYLSTIHEITRIKAGTWDTYFTSPPKEGMIEDFYHTGKIQRLLPGLNPRARVPEVSMLTTRPPKPS
jgi:hypothetical protein